MDFHVSTLSRAPKLPHVNRTIEGITANAEKCRDNVEKSTGVVTVLVPFVGYQRAAEIAKEALRTGISVREIILRDKILTEEELASVLDPVAMTEARKVAK